MNPSQDRRLKSPAANGHLPKADVGSAPKQGPETARVSAAGDAVKVYSNVIPLRRDRKGNPVPRKHVSLRPLVSLDPEALLETAEAFRSSAEDGKKHLPWLKARNAVAADANVAETRRELRQRMDAATEKAERQLEPLVRELDAASNHALAEEQALALKLAGIPIKYRPEDRTLDFAEDEPVTLEELAGQLGVPPPELKVAWWEKRGYKAVATVAGGIAFGISVGLMTGKIELTKKEEWPLVTGFVLEGVGLMAILGWVFPGLGKFIGTWLYTRGVRVPAVRAVHFAAMLILLAGLAVAVVMIESKVEQIGIFKAVAADSSLRSAKLSQGDLIWVSLMLAVPIVAAYVVSGLAEGERIANLANLRGELKKIRNDIRISENFAAAQSQFLSACDALKRKADLEQRMEALRSNIRETFTEEECQRLEDMEMDASRHSWETEDVMRDTSGLTSASGNPSLKKGFLGWVSRLFGRT